MSTLKQRLHRKNSSGEYDVVQLETSSDLVIRPDGTSVENSIINLDKSLNDKIPSTASCNKNWNWVGQDGQPTWMWGGNDPNNMYVYNPANFSVQYADSANHIGDRYPWNLVHWNSRNMTAEELNNPAYPYSYMALWSNGPDIGLPAGAWYITYMRNHEDNGYGCQVAYPQNPWQFECPRYRSAWGYDWLDWVEIVVNNENGISKLKQSLGLNTLVIPPKPINVGDIINMADLEWICVHEDDQYYFLMTRYVFGATVFNAYTATDNGMYPGSQVALLCDLFAEYIGVRNNPNFVATIGPGDTYGKLSAYCRIPTKSQMEGGFSYFTSDGSRKAYYRYEDIGHNNGISYWTSTTLTGGVHMYIVGKSGTIEQTNSNADCYPIRPYVVLKK